MIARTNRNVPGIGSPATARSGPSTGPRTTLVMVRGLCVLAVAALIALAPATAWAHGDDEAADAFTLVRQAIALIVNTPGNQMAIADKIDDALAAEDTDNVQVPLVQQAKDALAAGDLHRTRSLLEAAIGARVHTSTADPVPIGQPAPVTGEQTGTLATVDAISGRHGLTGTDWILLATSLVVAAAGIALSTRLRPHLPHPTRESRTP